MFSSSTGENLQTQLKKEFNSWPSGCKMTALLTVPLCRFNNLLTNVKSGTNEQDAFTNHLIAFDMSSIDLSVKLLSFNFTWKKKWGSAVNVMSYVRCKIMVLLTFFFRTEWWREEPGAGKILGWKWLRWCEGSAGAWGGIDKMSQ